jgi:hypothetical protein
MVGGISGKLTDKGIKSFIAHKVKQNAKLVIAFLLVLISFRTAIADNPCCGPITAAGAHLEYLINSSNVEKLWLAGRRIHWETGQEVDPDSPYRKAVGTHCSAFAASFAKKLGVYLPHPPEYSQILLANAQYKWLDSVEAVKLGWKRIDTAEQAQSNANQGRFVLAVFANPNPNKPGHIAIIKPSLKSSYELQKYGPQATQAGEKNYISTTIRHAFKYHPGAWPNGIRYYANTPKTE